MIRKNRTKLKVLHLLFDAFTLCLAYSLAWLVIIGEGGLQGTALSARVYFQALFLVVPVYLVLYAVFGLYSQDRTKSRASELRDIGSANVTGLMLFTFVLYAGRNLPEAGPYLRNFSIRMIVLFALINTILDFLFRNLARLLFRNMRKKGFNQRHVLLVGVSSAAQGFIDRIRQNPGWGYHIFGILDDERPAGSQYEGIDILGGYKDLARILEENDLDEIEVTLPLDQYEQLKPVVNTCEKSGVHTRFIPDYQNIIPTVPYTEDLEGLPVINIRHVPLTRPFNAMIKRLADIAGSFLLLILTSPVMLVMAVLVKTTSKGPVFFAQERVGLHNKPFRMYKFRSMYEQLPEEEEKGWTVKDDPRVTPVGKFMRRTNIDEFPQFFNILKGDMSLVGPRPERPQFVERFKEEIPRYMIKHQVRPGLTGWAQINGYRGDTSITRRIEYDLYYIENWTVELDIRILILTLFKGFRNAY